MCVCLWVCAQMDVCASGGQRTALGGFLRSTIHVETGSSIGLEFIKWAQLASQRPGSAGLCLPITGMVSTCHQAQLVHMGSGGVYSVPHDFMAVFLLTSSLPSPVPRFSRSVFKPLGMYLCGRISCLPHEDATIA